jgi:S-adenosyl methyltransferase
MGDNPASPDGGAPEDLMARVDTSVPVSARIWNYWMGGTDYYPIDRDRPAWCRSISGAPTPARSIPLPFPRTAESAGSPEPGYRMASAAGTGDGQGSRNVKACGPGPSRRSRSSRDSASSSPGM